MENQALAAEALSEHRFWLQIMGDHGRFIFDSLSVEEDASIQKARQFILIFDRLLSDARKPAPNIGELNRAAYDSTYQFRSFKLELLALSLESRLKSHLSASFFNHMLNELEEYLMTINALQSGQIPERSPIHYHLLWLSDAIGHAAGVSANLDEVEKDLIQKSLGYEKEFTDLYLKSVQESGYMRTGLQKFPSKIRLNEQAVSAMTPFMDFLEMLRDSRKDGRILGTLMPLMADHMAREECYYLSKLASSAEHVKKPDCDPARPRMGA